MGRQALDLVEGHTRVSLAMEARDGVTAELVGGDAMLRLGLGPDLD